MWSRSAIWSHINSNAISNTYSHSNTHLNSDTNAYKHPFANSHTYTLPGLGIKDNDLISFAKDFDYTESNISIDGLSARKYVSPEGYTILTLVGTTPYVEKVILEIDTSRENSFIATATWIYILEISTNYAGKPAADWVHDTYPKAVQSGREEKIFKKANVILEVTGNIFRLIIEPATK